MKLTKDMIKIIIALLIACSSYFGVSRVLTSPSIHQGEITYLDTKRNDVLGLVTVSTGASVALSAIPGDAGTPIANSFADMSSKFVIVLGAIYLEKYLTTVGAYIGCCWLIPAACLLYIIYVLSKNLSLKGIAAKLVILALVLNLLVPASVTISKIVDATYQTSIQEVIDQEENIEIQEGEKQEDASIWESALNWIEDKTESIVDGTTNAFSEFKGLLNKMIESFAVMIVTSCVIPVLVLLFLLWVAKLITGIDFNAHALQHMHTKKIMHESKE